jgi:hypothetical protein
LPLVRVVDVAAPLGREREHRRLVVAADLAEAGERGDVEVDRPAGLVGVATVEHHPDEAADVGDGAVARGSLHTGSMPRLTMSLSKRAVSAAARSR